MIKNSSQYLNAAKSVKLHFNRESEIQSTKSIKIRFENLKKEKPPPSLSNTI